MSNGLMKRRKTTNLRYDYCSDAALLADELSFLLEVFMQNGYPQNTVWRILYQENREKAGEKKKINLDYSLYVPFHPQEKRFIKS